MGLKFTLTPSLAPSLIVPILIVILSAAKNLADASGAAEMWLNHRRRSLRVGQILRAQGGPQDDAIYWRLDLL